MNITSQEVKELTTWLHKDVDESIEDAQSLYLVNKYRRIYECLEFLQQILEVEELNQSYQAMLGYSDDDPEVKCKVANVVPDNFYNVNEEAPNQFNLNDWFMSYTTDGHHIQVCGPYASMSLAMDYARELLNITEFRSPIY